MKIISVTESAIRFDNDTAIVFDHEQEGIEQNYADFEQLDNIARTYDFDEHIRLEAVDGAGFCFGDKSQMFFVPCYSVQNGCYSSDINIHYIIESPVRDEFIKLNLECEKSLFNKECKFCNGEFVVDHDEYVGGYDEEGNIILDCNGFPQEFPYIFLDTSGSKINPHPRIGFDSSFGEYGYESIPINYCPLCGRKLKPSKA